MRLLVQRAIVLVLAGIGLSLVGNQISPRGIPLITPPKREHKAEEFLPLEKAKELWDGGSAIFLDARSPDDFAAGHIGAAFNLPALTFEQHFGQVAPMLSPDSQIIVYCDGVECELSHRVADALKQQGYANVHILHNGWTVWRNAGLPTEQGPGTLPK